MLSNSNYKEELEKAIEDGVELFKYYKEISKEFQEQKKILMNNTDFKKELDNLKEKYNDEVKITKAQRNSTSSNYMKGVPNHVKAKQYANATAKLKELKNKYEKELEKFKQNYEKMSEIYSVNSEKKFLKEKEKIRKEKKRILSRIKIALAQLKKQVEVNDYKKLIKEILGSSYEISDNKKIRFKNLMHHLESGEISEEVAKTTKKIDDLMSSGNVYNRKKKMEIGIKQKEIEKLLKDYEKTNKLSKNSVEKEIKKLVKSLNTITNPKNKEKITTRIDKLSRSLKNEMTERQRKIKYEIATKMKQLEQLKASS